MTSPPKPSDQLISRQQLTADEHGHFSAPGLTPSNYVVLAFEAMQGDYRQPEFLKPYAE